MRLAILGATSQIAKDLVLSFAEKSSHELVLYARRPDYVSQWLSSMGLLGRYTAADFSAFSTDEHFKAVLNFVGVGDPAQAAVMGANIFDVTLKYDDMAMDYVRQHPDCRYIFLSSGAAYGASFDGPVDENTKAIIAVNQLQPQDWYGVAKFYAECRHRALSQLPIVDVRVFNYFSHTQNLEARFFITDVVRAIRDKTVLKTSTANMVRDYIDPSDFYGLVDAILASPATNAVVDCYSKAPINKRAMLTALKVEFGLQYEMAPDTEGNNIIGSKSNYYSKNRAAMLFGYMPNHDSLSTLLQEMRKIPCLKK
jgi:nucleoside-diphosphate-sugar epimerase